MWAWLSKDKGRRGEMWTVMAREGCGFRLFVFASFAPWPALAISFRTRGGSWDVLSWTWGFDSP